MITICKICRRNVRGNNLLSDLGGGGWWEVVGVYTLQSGKMSHVVRKLVLAKAGQGWCKLKSHHFLAWQLLTLIPHKSLPSYPSPTMRIQYYVLHTYNSLIKAQLCRTRGK